MSYADRDSLQRVTEPGTGPAPAGTLKKLVSKGDPAFLYSIGQGVGPQSVAGQLNGVGGSGDPTIAYPVGATHARVLGRTGAFGSPDHLGKQPLNYAIDLGALESEY